MLQNDKYLVINIRKYLESDNPKLGEDDLVQILSEFSCERNSDVERLLKNSAIESQRRTSPLHIWYFQWKMENYWDILQ